MKKILTVFIILLIHQFVYAENYYAVKLNGTKTSGVSTTDIGSFGWALSDCYSSIGAAIAQMSGGEQVWVDDGTYTASGNQITSVPSGNSTSDPSIIKARNTFGATLNMTSPSGNDVTISNDYITVRGFKIISSVNDDHAVVAEVGASYVYFKELLVRHLYPAGGGVYLYGDYGLAEDCAVCGGGRYQFSTGGISGSANHNIFRRCISRQDYSEGTSEPVASFMQYGNLNYDYVKDNAWQNCIALDNGDLYGTYYGGFYLGEKQTRNAFVRGCIALNLDNTGSTGGNSHYERGFVTTPNIGSGTNGVEIYNSVSETDGRGMSFGDSDVPSDIQFCYVLNHDRDYLMSLSGGGTVINSVFFNNAASAAYYSGGAYTNNWFYSSGTPTGSGQVTSDPNIQYLIKRITSGEVEYGAEILYKHGTDGAFWGDSGWDTVSSSKLWPWPNEDEIRDWFRTANFPTEAQAVASENNTTRGFCASGVTLTSYIVNYLGPTNTIGTTGTTDAVTVTADVDQYIYDESPDSTPPTVTSGSGTTVTIGAGQVITSGQQ